MQRAVGSGGIGVRTGGYNPQLASKIKDAMREQCLPQITDAWFSILQLHESAPSLVVACLNTMHLYVNWMDITLLSHPRFMALLLPFMRQPQLHDGACLCIGEIVLKRMEAPAKLHHIERLELVGALSEAAVAVCFKFPPILRLSPPASAYCPPPGTIAARGPAPTAPPACARDALRHRSSAACHLPTRAHSQPQPDACAVPSRHARTRATPACRLSRPFVHCRGCSFPYASALW